MKCPYCEKEMEVGLIQSPNELSWIKGDKRKKTLSSKWNEDSITLSKFSYMKGSAVISYQCSNCKKIIIDYDKNVDLNS